MRARFKATSGRNLASDSQRSVVLDPVSGQAYASRVAHITGNKTGAGIFLRNDRSDFLAGEHAERGHNTRWEPLDAVISGFWGC